MGKKIQVVSMDESQYILQYETFYSKNKEDIITYIKQLIEEEHCIRIAIRKFEDAK